jgi:hypothetical protein
LVSLPLRYYGDNLEVLRKKVGTGNRISKRSGL